MQFYLKPECVDEFKERAMHVLESMSIEDTFVVCYFHQDANDPTRFSVYEKWTEPSMDVFMETQLRGKAYRDEYEARLPDLLQSPRVITVLDPVKEWHRPQQ